MRIVGWHGDWRRRGSTSPQPWNIWMPAPPRGVDTGLITSLATGQWIRTHDNVLISGPTGAGKHYLACALGQMACRLGFGAAYHRLSRLLQDLALARGDGRCRLDDWGLAPLTEEARRDLLEVLDDRHSRQSSVVAS